MDVLFFGELDDREFWVFDIDCGCIVFVVYFSDGRVKYIFNKNSVKIEIFLFFGGKFFKDLKILDMIRKIDFVFKFGGLYLLV